MHNNCLKATHLEDIMSINSNIYFSSSEYTGYVVQNVKEEAVQKALFKLLEFAKNHAFKVKRGKGMWVFQYIIKTWDSTAMLYGWDTSAVYLRLGNFRMVHPSTISRFICSLTERSDGFDYLKRLEEGKVTEHFSIKGTIADPIIMDAFQKAVLEFQDTVLNTRV